MSSESSWFQELLSVYDDETALEWLSSPNDRLDGLTPIQAIRQGQESDVDCIVQQLTSGAYV